MCNKNLTILGVSIACTRESLTALTEFTSPLYELLYRCCLVITRDQERSLALMYNDLAGDAQVWKEKLIDIEDSRTVVEAFIKRLVRGDDGLLFDALDPAATPILLNFLTPFVEHGAKHLYPVLLRAAVNCMWESLVNMPDSQDSTRAVDCLRETFHSLG